MKVISTDAGIEMAVTRVERTESRNSRITITAKASPSRPSVASELIDSSMNGAWSKAIVNFVFWPRAFSSSGMRSRTSCDTATVLPAGVFVIAMVSASSPSTREMPVTGSVARATVATSDSGITAPVLPPSSGRAAISSVDEIRVPACTVRVVSFSVICPAGSSTPLASSASVMAWLLMPRSRSAS